MSKNPIPFELDGFPLLLPPDTQLPHIKKHFPEYGTNIGRLARTAAAELPNLTILDIGANVGDTLATLRRFTHAPILCIEGCDAYLPLLRHPRPLFQNVELEPAFIGNAPVPAQLTIERGTAFMTPTPNAPAIPTRPLDQILAAHPRFANAPLWKLDTDGWDAFILQHSAPLLARLRPILYFEYDPHFFTGPLADSPAIFETLRSLDYHDLLFWENTGDILLRTDLAQRNLLEDLHASITGRATARYYDIAAFPKEHSNLATKQRHEELTLFRTLRPQ